MSVELGGMVKMSGDSGSGAQVRVFCGDERLRLTAGDEPVGEWSIHEIGIHALNEGFVLRAEGEQFFLVTDDDAALADEMGIVASSPRLARQVAARHNPDDRPLFPESESVPSHVSAVAFALAGALVLVGATILRAANADLAVARGSAEVIEGSGVEFWVAFTLGGALMVALAYILSIGAPGGRIGAIAVLAGVIALFGMAVSDTATDATHLTAYGFLGGGLAVGAAVIFGGSLDDGD